MELLSQIEPLETRIAPAGLVTVTLTAGKLELVGDAEANNLTIDAVAPGQLLITGNNGTTVAFGGPAAATATVSGVVNELVSNLGGENDVLDLNYLNLAKGITITDTAGDNTVQLGSVRLGGDLSVTGGGGADVVTFDDYTFVAKAVKLVLGDGSNAVNLQSGEGTISSLNLLTGTGSDVVTKTSGDWEVKGPLTLVMGDGANDVNFTGGSVIVNGATTITHGTHLLGASSTNLAQSSALFKGAVTISYVDGLNVTTINPSNDLVVKGAFKLIGGSGDDAFTVSGGSALFGAGLSMSGGAGANTTNISPTNLTAKGFTYTGGTGADSVTVSGTTNTFTGLAAINLGDGINSFASGGARTFYNAGLNVTGGAGADAVSMGGTLSLTSILLRLGADNDVLSHNGAFLTVSGMADYGLGEGNNTINGFFYVANYGGLVKITAGSGDDSLLLSASSMNLAKGATFDGGTGANSLGTTGGVLSAGGDLIFNNGAHANGTSAVTISYSRVALDKGLTAKFTDGADYFVLSGANSVNVKGNVTITAPGTGASDFDLNGGSVNILGKLAATLGSDGGSITTSTTLLNIATLQVTGGVGTDVVNFSGAGQIGTVALSLGAGSSFVNFSGNRDGLKIAKALTITTPSIASADTDSLTLANLTLVGPTKIKQGVGVGSVTIDNVLAGAFSLDTSSGNDTIVLETNDTGIVSIFTGAAAFLLGSGTNSFTIGANTALGKADFRSTVLIVGGSETDTFTDNGNLFITGQPVLVNIP